MAKLLGGAGLGDNGDILTSPSNLSTRLLNDPRIQVAGLLNPDELNQGMMTMIIQGAG